MSMNGGDYRCASCRRAVYTHSETDDCETIQGHCAELMKAGWRPATKTTKRSIYGCWICVRCAKKTHKKLAGQKIKRERRFFPTEHPLPKSSLPSGPSPTEFFIGYLLHSMVDRIVSKIDHVDTDPPPSDPDLDEPTDDPPSDPSPPETPPTLH